MVKWSNYQQLQCHARMNEIRTTKIYNAISLCPNMERLRISSIT